MKKQPSKADLATQFNKFKDEVLLDMSLTQNAANAKWHIENNTAGFWRHHSARDIQDTYGSACAKLFLIVFIKYKRGGRNFEGKPYKTIWKLDETRAIALRDALMQTKNVEFRTAHHITEILIANGFAPVERVVIWDETGERKTVDFLSGDDLKEVKALKRVLRQQTREQLRQEREQMQATA